MVETVSEVRRFKVRARHEDGHHGRIVTEPTFEAAAIAYIEHHPVPAEVGRTVAVIVRDLHDGHEHCFRVDLETGETAACG